MSTNHTANYNLSQWVKSDKVQMEDFNADNAKLDAALGSLSSSVSSLQSAVSGKASASALNSLSATVGQHTAALAGKGNCSVLVLTYTATGFSGETRPNSISCPAKPVAVLIANNDCNVILMRGLPTASVRGKYGIDGIATAIWGDSSVSWYGSSARAQMNETGEYTAVVFMQND